MDNGSRNRVWNVFFCDTCANFVTRSSGADPEETITCAHCGHGMKYKGKYRWTDDRQRAALLKKWYKEAADRGVLHVSQVNRRTEELYAPLKNGKIVRWLVGGAAAMILSKIVLPRYYAGVLPVFIVFGITAGILVLMDQRQKKAMESKWVLKTR